MEFKIAKANLLQDIEEVVQGINNCNINLLAYKAQHQNNSIKKGNNFMKNLLNTIKTIILTGAMTILTIIPVMADSQPILDKAIADHYIMENGDVKTIYKDNSYVINSDVEIQSIDYFTNSITIDKQGQSYKFYVDEPRNYYLDEQINITINQDNEIIDYIVDLQPQVYNTSISLIQGNTAFLNADGNKYSFENIEGQDGWIVGDKCKAVIQDNKLLEVRPIPLAER